MRVQNINSQNFEAKKFRLSIKALDFTEPKYGMGAPRFKIPVNYVKEYENPNAEQIYKEAMKIKNPLERVKKLDEMGDYKLIDVSWQERLRRFFDKMTMDILW